MAICALSFCVFAWLSNARAARLTVEQVEELPWTKAVAIGTLGSALSSDAVVARPETTLEGSMDLEADPSGDVFDHAESALNAFLREYSLEDEMVVRKLLDDLRRSKSFDRAVVETLDASLRGRFGGVPKVLGVSSKVTDKQVVQQIMFPDGKSKRGLVIGRYLSHFREMDDVHAFRNMLQSMALSKAHDELFLRCIAQSHTAEELEGDSNTEFMILLEPFSGTIQEFVKDNNVTYLTRMSLFVDAMRVVNRVYELGIPHKSDIGHDTVLVKGEASAPESLKIVLSPAILLNGSRISPMDKFNADVQQLGSLLRWMFNSSTWPEDAGPAVDVILAFGKAMESGAFFTNHQVLKELSRMMDVVFLNRSTYSELVSMRIEYLRLAVDAAGVESSSADAGRSLLGESSARKRSVLEHRAL